eukprot:CAMPEP_0202864386 /NCGR_PEP_ID=MMETSP1391-20130828/4646_1 /ASSEMBLY_ACC=CAM_ASM_000867 /TAXON_ID=1034604 /ORGANISM="Chlamydomonas leiostraca, Strain SAG 11-49" /LENGTH=75 /DNA_ID=CAMNT_0049544119 /DNA_START=429 /DNA_END=657 /DNA_ORIENTATION=-
MTAQPVVTARVRRSHTSAASSAGPDADTSCVPQGDQDRESAQHLSTAVHCPDRVSHTRVVSSLALEARVWGCEGQ